VGRDTKGNYAGEEGNEEGGMSEKRVKCPKCGVRIAVINNTPVRVIRTPPDEKGDYWMNKMCRDGKVRLVKCHNHNQGRLF